MRPAARLPFRPALAAFLAGDAIGNVTPLGLAASEPTKVFLARHHLATADAVSSLATDNLVYAASALAMVGVGVVVLLVTCRCRSSGGNGAWRRSCCWSPPARPACGCCAAPGRPSRARGPRGAQRLAGMRQSVLAFSAANPARLWQAFGLGMAFHALAVLEVFFTLGLIQPDAAPTLSQSVVFEALNRVQMLAFKFVPFRVGVDEALVGRAGARARRAGRRRRDAGDRAEGAEPVLGGARPRVDVRPRAAVGGG